MHKITTAETLQLKELLQTETNALAGIKAVQGVISDEELKNLVVSGIQASEARIKGIQNCINDKVGMTEEVN